MVIRVNVPEELAAQAEARGVPLEAYVEELLARQVAATSAEVRRPQTPEEIRAWLDSLAQFSDKIPTVPETISREWIDELLGLFFSQFAAFSDPHSPDHGGADTNGSSGDIFMCDDCEYLAGND